MFSNNKETFYVEKAIKANGQNPVWVIINTLSEKQNKIKNKSENQNMQKL